MNIFSVFSTQGSQGLGAVKGVEAAQSAKAAARQEGVGEVHDAVTLSVDAVKAADSTADIRFDRVAALQQTRVIHRFALHVHGQRIREVLCRFPSHFHALRQQPPYQ